MAYAPPTGLPPQRTGASTAGAHASADDPPPAYTPSAGVTGHTSLQSGPLQPDFSGPPPMPDRVEQNITGVGIGYGHRHGHVVAEQYTGQSTQSGWGGSQYTGAGTQSQPPPQHPSRTSSYAPPPSSSSNAQDYKPSHTSTASGSSTSGPSRASLGDMSPTETPTPGRPLLYRGQLLVYPLGFWCGKCGNTGYKGNDPSNPHDADWRKYGKPYNSALAHSYTISVDPAHHNPSTSSSGNFQRPLPSLAPAGGSGSSFSHLPPPPSPGGQGAGGKWHTYPGQSPLPPPPQHVHHQQPAQAQQIFVQATAGPAPPGALVVAPGDPRIGGQLCYRCNGSGQELSFFGFDDGRCDRCRGLGRIF